MSRYLLVALLLALSCFPSFAEPPDDSLPDGAIARLGSYRFYHGGEIQWMTISPDGKLVASCNNPSDDMSRSVCVWDSATGDCLHRFDVSIADITRPAFSPDGKYLAIPLDDHVDVWNLSTKRIGWTVPLSGELCRDGVQFSKSGRELILKYSDGCATWHDLQDDKVVRQIWAWPAGRPSNDLDNERE